MAKEEKILPDANPYVAQYMSELERELEKLYTERAELDKLTTTSELTQEQLRVIRDRLKDFSNNIKFEPPEIQHLLIEQYIDTIVFDKLAGHLKVQFHVNYSSRSDETEVKILEKTVVISLD